MADEKILIQIEVDNDKAQKSLTEQTRKVDLLKEANAKLIKNNKELAKQGSVTAKKRAENSKQIAINRSKIAESNKTIKDSIKTLKTQENSYGAMKLRLKEVSEAIDKVDLSTEAGVKSVKKLREEQNQLNTSLKAGEAEGNSFTRNVGNYTNGIKDAIGQTTGFGGALDGVGQVIKLNPIGLLLSGLAALIGAFSKTEKGAKFFAVTGEVINQLFNELVGLLGKVGTSLVDLNFEDIGNSIKTYLVDQVKLVIKGFGLLGDAFVKLFDGDFSGAMDSAADGLKTLYIEANPLAQAIVGVADATVEFTEKVIENTNATIDNASARFELERSIAKQQVTISKLVQEEEKLNKIADDATLSLNKQKEANENYQTALTNRLNAEKKLINDQLGLLKTDLEIRKSQGLDVIDIQQQVADKQIELNAKITEQQTNNYDQQQRERQINQDQWEQDLDFIIDIGTRRADVLLKQSEDETLSLSEREQAIKDYSAALTSVQKGIINSFEESGLSEKEFKRLLGIRDPEQLAEEIKKLKELSEIENNRLKEGLQEYIIAEQDKTNAILSHEEQRNKVKEDYAKKEITRRKAVANAAVSLASNIFQTTSKFLKEGSTASKIFAVADATVNTYKGVTNALANVPAPFNIPAAIATGAQGFAAVQSINSTSPSSSNGGSGGGGSSLINGSTPQANPQIDTNPIDQQLAQQEALIAATGNIGMSVSVTEINNTQNDVRISEETATI